MLNCSPGGMYVPLMIRDASLMLCTRVWPTGNCVVKEEIFSLGRVALAMAVVNVGSVGLVATVAVRVVVEMAFQTSLVREVSSSASPATCGRTVGVRPEKVTTASLASTSTSAFSAAACTIACQLLGVGAGRDGARVVRREHDGGDERLRGEREGLLARRDGHRAGDGDVGELAAHPGELVGA